MCTSRRVQSSAPSSCPLLRSIMAPVVDVVVEDASSWPFSGGVILSLLSLLGLLLYKCGLSFPIIGRAVADVNSWAVSLVASIVYLGLFLHISNDPHNSRDLLYGFCVAGAPSTPTKGEGCHETPWNSHMASFAVDLVLGGVVTLLHARLRKRGRLSPAITTHFTAMGVVILSHGILHLYISEGINCYVALEEQPLWLITSGYLIFAGFSFFLCVVILGTTFAAPYGWTKVFFASALFANIVLLWTVETGAEWMLPALFSVLHPLACVAGLAGRHHQDADSETRVAAAPLTQLQGWSFLLATLMGILELTQCAAFYRHLGGHVWYDFWLHVTVVLGLPPFAPLPVGKEE